ncbi:MAG: hypothetical protein ACYTKD_07045 [Planctomycetota bacterium]|jgi:hypothetical protein
MSINILKMELLDANTMEVRSGLTSTACGPTIELDPMDVADASITEDGRVRIHLSGTVIDKVADIVPRQQGSHVTRVFVEDQELAVTDQNAQTSDSRPYAYEGRFDGYVDLGLPTAEVVYEVVTEENALGLVGRATFTVAGHVEERESAGVSYLLSPFNIRIGQEFTSDAADTIWMLLPTNVSFAIDTVHDPAAPLDPANPDQITFTIGTEAVALTEDGAQSLRFVGTSPSHGLCELVLDSMSGLSTESADESGGTVSVGDVCAGAALRYSFAETGDATYEFGGEREIALSEDQGAPDSLSFEASTTDHGDVSVEVSSFTGLRETEPDGLLAAVELPSAWTGMAILLLTETDVNSGLFNYVATSGDIAGEPVLTAAIDSVSVGTATGEGTFMSYFVRISDPTGQQKDHMTVGGVDLELRAVAGQDGVYITKEPFAVLREAANVSDDHLIVNAADHLECDYNPTVKWPHGDLTVPNFFAGPFYVNGEDLQFDAATEGLVELKLSTDVDNIAVVVYPKSHPTRIVYELPAAEAANMKSKGTHRFWDGKTNTAGSVDADDRPNNRGAEWKYVDPAYGVHVLKVTTTKAGKQEIATVEFTPRAKRFWVYNDADRGAQDRPIAEPYPSGGLAYSEAGYLHLDRTASTAGGQGSYTINERTGDLRTSRFTAQADPDALNVVYEYGDGLTFGDIFRRLTARGHLTSIGHGAGAAIWLDGGDHVYTRFEHSDTVIGGEDGGPYRLPYLGVHGVRIWLKHCFTAMGDDSHAQQILDTLTHGDGVGGGTVTGYTGFHEIIEAPGLGRLQRMTLAQMIEFYDLVFAKLSEVATDAIGAPTADAQRDERLTGRATMPISAGTASLGIGGLGFERGGGTATFDGGDAFTFNACEVVGGRMQLTGCAGIEAHPGVGRISFRHPTRGNLAHFSRWALHSYPIEDRNGMDRNFRVLWDAMLDIDLGAGRHVDDYFKFYILYETRLRGGTEASVTGGR